MHTPTILILLALHVVMAFVPLAFNVERDCGENEFACEDNPANNPQFKLSEDENKEENTNTGLWGSLVNGVKNVGGAVFGGAKAIYQVGWTFFTFDYDWMKGGPQIQQYAVWILRSVLGTIQAIMMARLFMSMAGRQL